MNENIFSFAINTDFFRNQGVFMLKKILLMLCLIGCMTVIFLFSSQNGTRSGNISGGVTETLAKIFIDGFEELSLEKQKEIVEGMHFYVRKAAHFSIYAVLGFFSFLNADIYLKKNLVINKFKQFFNRLSYIYYAIII